MSKRVSFLSLAVLTIIFCMIGCTPEDASSPQPEDFFIKYYGTSSAEVVVDVLPYERSNVLEGYLVLGSTNVNGDLDYLLVKTDVLGNQLWEQRIGFTRNDGTTDLAGNDTPSEMVLYDETHVAIIGTTNISIGGEIQASRIFVATMDVSGSSLDGASGDLVNTFTFPAGIVDGDISEADQTAIIRLNAEGKSILRPVNISGTPESALILLGNTDNVSTTKTAGTGANDIQDIYLSKVNFEITSGTVTDIEFEQVFGFPGEDVGHKVLQHNSGFAISGITDSDIGIAGGGKNILMYYLNLDGGVGPNAVIGDDADDTPSDFVVNGTKVMILGNSTGGSNEALLIDTSINGSADAATTTRVTIPQADATNAGNIGSGLIRLQNGDFFVTGKILGYTDPVSGVGKGEGEVLLYRADQSGSVDLTSLQIFGGIGDDKGNTIIQNVDQTLMIGATIDFQGGTTMMSLLKTNSMGEFSK